MLLIAFMAGARKSSTEISGAVLIFVGSIAVGGLFYWWHRRVHCRSDTALDVLAALFPPSAIVDVGAAHLAVAGIQVGTRYRVVAVAQNLYDNPSLSPRTSAEPLPTPMSMPVAGSAVGMASSTFRSPRVRTHSPCASLCSPGPSETGQQGPLRGARGISRCLSARDDGRRDGRRRRLYHPLGGGGANGSVGLMGSGGALESTVFPTHPGLPHMPHPADGTWHFQTLWAPEPRCPFKVFGSGCANS